MKYYIPKDRFIVIAVILFIFWLGIMGLLYYKADEVTKHPCKICADKVGDKVTCTTGGLNPVSRTFVPENYTENARTFFLQGE